MKQILACSALGVFMLGSPAFSQATPGVEIVNTVQADYSVGGIFQDPRKDDATFVVDPPRTDSTLSLQRYSVAHPDALTRPINGSDYLTKASDSFTPLPTLDELIVTPLEGGAAAMPLAHSVGYTSDDIVFVEVIDMSANVNGTVIDKVTVEIKAESGDYEVLRLYETGPNTGIFVAYIPTSSADTEEYDGSISSVPRMVFTATYRDSVTASDVSEDSGVIEPLSVVFDSITLEPVDGAVVRVIDVESGEEAALFGVDGYSSFNNGMISGQDAQDESSVEYLADTGNYYIPHIRPGTYRIEVDPPEGYEFPSNRAQESLEKAGAAVNGMGLYLKPGSWGATFTVTAGGPYVLDIPLDRPRGLLVRKTANTDHAAVGDFVEYRVSVENGNTEVMNNIVLTDRLPLGFVYQTGSLEIDGSPAAQDPAMSSDGRTLTLELETLAVSQVAEVSYVLKVGPGAPDGTAVNSAQVKAEGGVTSTVASASITVHDDMRRTDALLIGEVLEGDCDAPGMPVEGARIYTQKGTFVTTAEDGKFHVEGLTAGTHVIALDMESLEGYEPLLCEEDDHSRSAGRATSRFVDLKGGSVWREGFRVVRKASGEEVAQAEERSEEEAYSSKWLAKQESEFRIVFPEDGAALDERTLTLGVLHRFGDRVQVTVNGEAVSKLNAQEGKSNRRKKVSLKRWGGIDLKDGANSFRVRVTDKNGKLVAEETRTVYYVNAVERVAFAPEHSVLIADGRTSPQIAIQATDSAGRVVHRGAQIRVRLQDPYLLKQDSKAARRGITTSDAEAVVPVGDDGIALVSLMPTPKTGQARLTVLTDTGKSEEFSVLLRPAARDWIVVGFAQGTAGYNTLSGNLESAEVAGIENEVFTDGKVQFFAKGAVKGEWLLTLAYDSEKNWNEGGENPFKTIDPLKHYPVYGDYSERGEEAQSSYPLFVKLERENFMAMFGDYQTELEKAYLSRYKRSLSGVKSRYQGDRYGYVVFAAESKTGYQREEIPADGSSGPFSFAHDSIISGTDTITVEVRDSRRADKVISRQELLRHRDYTVDYTRGEIILREPLSSFSRDFHRNIIVMEYETASAGERALTAGGRAYARVAGDLAEVGVTFIHESNSGQAGNEGQLAGVDVTASVTDDIKVRAEAAMSKIRDREGADTSGKALHLEASYQGQGVSGKAYASQIDAEFAVGQQSVAAKGKRTLGVEGVAVLARGDALSETAVLSAQGKVVHETALADEHRRLVAEAELVRTDRDLSTSLGVRSVREDGGPNATQIIAKAARTALDGRVKVFAEHEQSIGNNANTVYPTRTRVGVDVRPMDQIGGIVAYERAEVSSEEVSNVHAGLYATPIAGNKLNLALNGVQDGLERNYSSVASVHQTFRLDDKRSISAGLEHVEVFGKDKINPPSIFTYAPRTEDATTGHLGYGYDDEEFSASARIEHRHTKTSDQTNLSAAAYGEYSETVSLGASFLGVKTRKDADGDSLRVNARLGLAYRPLLENFSLLDRMEFEYEEKAGGEQITKFINNLAVNYRPYDDVQLSFGLGLKAQRAEFGGTSYDSLTGYTGTQVRFDVTERVDIGLHAHALTDLKEWDAKWGGGVSVGFSPVDDVWVRAGYNFEGFESSDFFGAGYTAQGPWIQINLKFDSLTSLLQQNVAEE